jgi:cysteine desulfurase
MTVNLPIYFDNNATTPLDKRVLQAMMPYLAAEFGNAASKFHVFGQRAGAAVEKARCQVAVLIGAKPTEIVFTSGATESDNLAIKGIAEMYRHKGNHIITCMTEHKAVIDTCKYLETKGYRVTWLKPDEYGRVTAEQVEDAITDRTILITIMAANNETGTLHPVAEIGKVAQKHDVIFHSDATQAAGKIPVNVETMGIGLMSISAHKMYGPKGIGGLYVRRREPRVRLAIQMHGGGHEKGKRSGTLNVPGIVGLGAACEIAAKEMSEESERIAKLRDRLQKEILNGLDDVALNGHPTERLPNTINISFAYVEGETVVLSLADELAVSTGSACSSESLESSHVLMAMGVPEAMAHSSIRLSLGRFNTTDEVDYAVKRVIEVVQRRRKMSPVKELQEVFGVRGT